MRRLPVVLLVVWLSSCSRSESPIKPESIAQPASKQPTTAAMGQQFPAYHAPGLDGAEYDIEKHRGDVILLNLWATWCVPCRAEMPELERIHESNASRRFSVVGVTIDAAEEEAAVRAFVAKEKISYPILLDPEAHLQEILGAMAIPASALIDRQGRVVWMRIGMIPPNDPELEEALKKAL